jgi:hypothetical protein
MFKFCRIFRNQVKYINDSLLKKFKCKRSRLLSGGMLKAIGGLQVVAKAEHHVAAGGKHRIRRSFFTVTRSLAPLDAQRDLRVHDMVQN